MHQDEYKYTGPENRHQGRTIADVEDAFDRKLQEHEVREQERILGLFVQFKLEAFPDGPILHREWHQAMIDASKAEKKFWDDLRGDVLKKSIWGVLQILMTLIGLGLAAKFGISVIGGK